jgi:hypothetical protein
VTVPTHTGPVLLKRRASPLVVSHFKLRAPQLPLADLREALDFPGELAEQLVRLASYKFAKFV